MPVVDEGADAAVAKAGSEAIAIGRAHHEEVPGVLAAGQDAQGPHGGVRERAEVVVGDRSPPNAALGELRYADPQDRGLELVEAAVDPGERMASILAAAVDAQHPHALDDLRIRGDHGAAVAERREVLGRVEAEAAASPKPPAALPPPPAPSA